MTNSTISAHSVTLMTTPQYQTRLTDALRTRYIGSKAWRDVTFYSFIKKGACEHPDRVVFIDERRSLTYGELKDQVDRCATFLKGIGIGPGDVVTIQFPNRIEFPIVFFSLELIGAIANKISPDFRRHEVEYILRFSNSKAFVCASNFKGFDYAAMIDELRPTLPNLTTVVVSGDSVIKHVHSLEQGLATAAPLAAAERVHMSPDAVMRMAFTSGTTGDPKGVMHCFNTTLYAAEVINSEMHVTSDEVLLIWLPVGLNWGYLSLLQTVMVGGGYTGFVAYEPFQFHLDYMVPPGSSGLLNSAGASGVNSAVGGSVGSGKDGGASSKGSDSSKSMSSTSVSNKVRITPPDWRAKGRWRRGVCTRVECMCMEGMIIITP